MCAWDVYLESSKQLRMFLTKDLSAEDGVNAANDEQDQAGVTDWADRVAESLEDLVEVFMTFEQAQHATDAKKAEGFGVGETRDPGGEGEQRGHDDASVQEIRAVGEEGSEAVVAVREKVEEQLARKDQRQRHFYPVEYRRQPRIPLSHTGVLGLKNVAQEASADEEGRHALERCGVEEAPSLCSC